jgi:ABC-2 type transport system permease protein
MPKYLQLAKITIQEYFVYRLNFLLWRFRSLVSFLTLFFFWLAIYANRSEFLGYYKDQMLTYVVGTAFLSSIVVASRSVDLAGQIRSGELTKIVLTPFNIFKYWLTRDITDKVLNTFFTIIEICLVAVIMKFPLYIPKNIVSVFIFLLITTLSVFLYFFLSMFLAITAFWTEEIWATRWLFGVVILDFFAGNFFPIDVLPTWLTKVIYLTPFPYLMFFPLKIWLEQISLVMAWRAILVCAIWLVVFYWLAKFLWQKGARNYGAYGS